MTHLSEVLNSEVGDHQKKEWEKEKGITRLSEEKKKGLSQERKEE